MILVSIVIPVYNKEEYLEDCLQSVLNQSFESIEIIIVNDGSTDQSSEIIKSYSDKDSRIRIINQKNQGVAVARNRGVDIAKGEYIYFLDADDLLLEDSISRLSENAKNSSFDIIVGNYYRKTNDEFEKNNYYSEKIVTKQELTSIQFQAEMFLFRQRALASSCNKLYKRTS